MMCLLTGEMHFRINKKLLSGCRQPCGGDMVVRLVTIKTRRVPRRTFLPFGFVRECTLVTVDGPAYRVCRISENSDPQPGPGSWGPPSTAAACTCVPPGSTHATCSHKQQGFSFRKTNKNVI